MENIIDTKFDGDQFIDWVNYNGDLDPESIATAFNKLLEVIRDLHKRIEKLENE